MQIIKLSQLQKVRTQSSLLSVASFAYYAIVYSMHSVWKFWMCLFHPVYVPPFRPHYNFKLRCVAAMVMSMKIYVTRKSCHMSSFLSQMDHDSTCVYLYVHVHYLFNAHRLRSNADQRKFVCKSTRALSREMSVVNAVGKMFICFFFAIEKISYSSRS